MPEKKGLKNAYTCNKLHSVITINVDDGTTPMFLNCPTCGGRSVSRMGDIDADIPATHEWYKPTVQELEAEIDHSILTHQIKTDHMKESFSMGMKEHVKQGGLLLRKK